MIRSAIQNNYFNAVADPEDEIHDEDKVQVQVSPAEEQEFDAMDDEIYPVEDIESEDELDSRSCRTESEVTFKRRKFSEVDLEDDPVFQNVVDKLVEKKLKLALEAREGECNNSPLNKGANWSTIVPGLQIKSPSDTTIYAPGLKRITPNKVTPTRIGLDRSVNNENIQNQMMNQISDFVENIRLETSRVQNSGIDPNQIDIQEVGPSKNVVVPPKETETQRNVTSLQEAKKAAEKLIVEAEQFKATIAPKPGTVMNVNTNLSLSQIIEKVKESLNNNSDSDDEFFHVTCHLEPSLKQRIEAGGYVELERLLPKTKSQILKDDKKLQFFYQDGETFFAPAERENKITNIHRWEQAFRVYAAVYCAANPGRSVEIWQYVYTINKAASSYTWENVYFYDVTFRQLMASNQTRSWAKTYTQMWNIALCDPVQRSQMQYGVYAGHKTQNSGAGNNNTGRGTVARPKYCWKFNKNKTHDSSCEFVHRCSFCDGAGHSRLDCNK